MAMRQHNAIRPKDRMEGRCSGLSHFESLKPLDEAGFTRLSLARHTAICGRNSTAFCEVTLENAPFTRTVKGCISSAVMLDVR